MASVVRDPNGRKRITFTAEGGSRRTIRLGKCDVKQAEAIRLRVESLLNAAVAGTVDAETSRWVANLPDEMHHRLARAGIVQAREQTKPTLDRLLTTFFANIDVKAGTRTTYAQTRQSLETRFGKDRLLATLGALEAEQWRQSLRESGLAEATISKRVKTAR